MVRHILYACIEQNYYMSLVTVMTSWFFYINYRSPKKQVIRQSSTS